MAATQVGVVGGCGGWQRLRWVWWVAATQVGVEGGSDSGGCGGWQQLRWVWWVTATQVGVVGGSYTLKPCIVSAAHIRTLFIELCCLVYGRIKAMKVSW